MTVRKSELLDVDISWQCRHRMFDGQFQSGLDQGKQSKI